MSAHIQVLGAAYPWIARRLLTQSSPELQATLRKLLYKDNRFQFGRLESLLQQAARAPNRASSSSGTDAPAAPAAPVAVASEAAADSGNRGGSSLALLLSPEAAFVRDILIDELAKGLVSGRV